MTRKVEKTTKKYNVFPTCFGRGTKLQVTLLVVALSMQIIKEQERDQLLLFQLQQVTCIVLGQDKILVQTQWQEAKNL